MECEVFADQCQHSVCPWERTHDGRGKGRGGGIINE